MSTDLTTTSHSGASLQERMTYAKALAAASLLPSSYRGRPADVLVAIETGDMLGIAPMAAINNVHVIEGKPTFSAGLMAALVRKAGHKIRMWGDEEKAVVEIVRADDPGFTFRSEWTINGAVAAGLVEIRDGKPYARDRKGRPGPWERYTAAMLKARATSQACRDACSDVFLGPVYVPEELGADVDADGDPVNTSTTQPSTPVDDNVQDAEVVDEPAAEPAGNATDDEPGTDTPDSDDREPVEASSSDAQDWEGAIEHALEFEHAIKRREAFVHLYKLAVEANRAGRCPDTVVARISELGAEAKRDMEETEQVEQHDA